MLQSEICHNICYWYTHTCNYYLWEISMTDSVCVCLCVYACACMPASLHVCVCVHAWSCARMHVCMQHMIYACALARMSACMCRCNVRMHEYVFCVCVCECIYIYLHKCVCVFSTCLWRPAVYYAHSQCLTHWRRATSGYAAIAAYLEAARLQWVKKMCFTLYY